MAKPQVNIDGSYRGLRTVVLENRLLRLVILPEAGAKIWQITYRPHNTDLLWNNPGIAPARWPMSARYDEVWSGGWDELFPNDETATIGGDIYPGHGELWTGEWQAEPFQLADEAGVTLRFTTPMSSIRIEKTILLREWQPRIYSSHVFTNTGSTAFPFLWKLHPALAVSAEHRIDFPAMQVVLEPAFLGTLDGAPPKSDWPFVRVGSRDVDLRKVAHADERQLYFFYGINMKAGWCALTNTATGLACGLKFDQSIFPCSWLFATYGGWRNYNVAVLEPCTGYPLNFDALRGAGRHRTLAPGECLKSEVIFSVQEGLRSVGHMEENGTFIEASEEVLR